MLSFSWQFSSTLVDQLLVQCAGISVVHTVLFGVAAAAFCLAFKGLLPVALPAKICSHKKPLTRCVSPDDMKDDTFLPGLPRALAPDGDESMHEPPAYGHLQGVLHSGDDRGLVFSDPPEPYCFENELCYGQYVPLFRPTVDTDMDAPGLYRNHAHFKGKKRLWENRFQIKFKVPVEGDGGLRFGAQLSTYVPLGVVTNRTLKLLVGGLRKVVGQDLYHSCGDAPATEQESEPPVIAMPIWAMDQFMMTPEGEEPPQLNDPAFSTFGMKRAGDRKAFVQELQSLEFKPGPTYTFAFWGPSQFGDMIKWVLKTGPVATDFNQFAGRPPVTVSMYSLKKGSLSEKDQRHLESRKNVYFRVDFWSSRKSPAEKDIRDLFPRIERGRSLSPVAKKGSSFSNFFACCAAR